MSTAGDPRHFDFAILGGGLAGLSLALRLAQSELGARRIVIVEPTQKDQNDRTWCFWAAGPTPFDSLCRRRWDTLRFVDDQVERIQETAPFHYQMLRSLDFYRHAHAVLDRLPYCTRLVGEAAGLADGPETASFVMDGEVCTASWVFDSRYRASDLAQLSPTPAPASGENWPSMLQHFLGWEVATARPVFDPAVATLFDLRAPQPAGLGFFYLLPFSPTRALVEYTQFSPGLLAPDEYRQALRAYLETVLHAGSYQVIEEEAGVIPMTARSLPRRQGKRILAIGTRGGRVKPSTGFAFARIQMDSEAILRSLRTVGHPFHLQQNPLRFRLYDAMLLEVLLHSPQHARAIFQALFTRNPAARLLRFINEQSHYLEELQVMASVPPGPFLTALLRQGLAGLFPRKA